MAEGGFAARHPGAVLCFFTAELLLTAFLANPVCAAVSLAGAVLYAGRARGGTGKYALTSLAIAAVLAVVNALFNHRGETALFLLPRGSAVTLESLLAGATAGATFAAGLYWCVSLSVALSSDKLTYLFGKAAPSLSMLLSMALRFVPRFARRYRLTREAAPGAGNPLSRELSSFSATVGYSLENSAETALSMKSRGYGLPGRTAHSPYKFTDGDRLLLCWTLFAAAFTLCLAAAGAFSWSWFPAVKFAEPTPLGAAGFAVYSAFSLTPFMCEELWEAKWKFLRRGA